MHNNDQIHTSGETLRNWNRAAILLLLRTQKSLLLQHLQGIFVMTTKILVRSYPVKLIPASSREAAAAVSRNLLKDWIPLLI